MKEQPEQVIFRVDRGRDGEVFALFPNIAADYAGRYVQSYQHVGQHAAADYGLCVANSRPAKPHEFAALKRELEGRGYKLDVRRRRARWQYAS
jgi:hypothetical protein